jgi:hypothetical protein
MNIFQKKIFEYLFEYFFLKNIHYVYPTRRFTGITLSQYEDMSHHETTTNQVIESSSNNPFEVPNENLDKTNPFFEGEGTEEKENKTQSPNSNISIMMPNLTPFHGIISKCFEPYLHIYIESQDQNLVSVQFEIYRFDIFFT